MMTSNDLDEIVEKHFSKGWSNCTGIEIRNKAKQACLDYSESANARLRMELEELKQQSKI